MGFAVSFGRGRAEGRKCSIGRANPLVAIAGIEQRFLRVKEKKMGAVKLLCSVVCFLSIRGN